MLVSTSGVQSMQKVRVEVSCHADSWDLFFLWGFELSLWFLMPPQCNGGEWNLVCADVPQRMNPTDFGDFSCTVTMRLAFVVRSEISWQLSMCLIPKSVLKHCVRNVLCTNPGFINIFLHEFVLYSHGLRQLVIKNSLRPCVRTNNEGPRHLTKCKGTPFDVKKSFNRHEYLKLINLLIHWPNVLNNQDIEA